MQKRLNQDSLNPSSKLLLPQREPKGSKMEAYSPSENPKKINVISTFAFMFSVLIYVSVFYFCRVSPLILLHTTKFWFFLSNNLVLIIAIDYNTFSASKQDLYEETITHSRTRSVSTSQFVKQDQEYIIRARTSKIEFENDLQEKEELNHTNGENPEFKTTKMIEAGERSNIQVVDSGRRGEVEETERDVMSERENDARKSESEKEEEETSVDNEFSTMTDEELNRRVEEFIRRFNNEIRLQALRNLHQN